MCQPMCWAWAPPGHRLLPGSQVTDGRLARTTPWPLPTPIPSNTAHLQVLAL